jgi:hypothetical protein
MCLIVSGGSGKSCADLPLFEPSGPKSSKDTCHCFGVYYEALNEEAVTAAPVQNIALIKKLNSSM